MPKLKIKHKFAPEIDWQCQNCGEQWIRRLSPTCCPRCDYPIDPMEH